MSSIVDYGIFIGEPRFWDQFCEGPGTKRLSLPIQLQTMGEGIPSCLHFLLPRFHDGNGSEILLVSWGFQETAVFLMSFDPKSYRYRLYLLGAQRGGYNREEIFAGAEALFGLPRHRENREFLVLEKALRGFRLTHATIPVHLSISPFLYPHKKGVYTYRVKTTQVGCGYFDLVVSYGDSTEERVEMFFRGACNDEMLGRDHSTDVFLACLRPGEDENHLVWTPDHHSQDRKLPHIEEIKSGWTVVASHRDDYECSNRIWGRRPRKRQS